MIKRAIKKRTKIPLNMNNMFIMLIFFLKISPMINPTNRIKPYNGTMCSLSRWMVW